MTESESPATEKPSWKNPRGWLKLKALSILGQEHGEKWYSVKRLRKAFREIYQEEVSLDNIRSSLNNYHHQYLCYKKKLNGLPNLYKITEKGVKRYLYLSNYFIPDLVTLFQDHPNVLIGNSEKIGNDISQILGLMHDCIDWEDQDDITMFLDVMKGNDLEWRLAKEALKQCDMIGDREKKQRCLRSLKQITARLASTSTVQHVAPAREENIFLQLNRQSQAVRDERAKEIQELFK